MKNNFFFIILCASAVISACTMAGTDKKTSAPVVSIEQCEKADTLEEDHNTADTLVVAMTGDIMMGTTYPAHALPENDGYGLFRDVKDILGRADIAAGNLEGTLCDTASTTEKEKSEHSYSFRTPVEFAPRLKEAGYDFLCMANNHAYDFGFEGVRSTEKTLDKLGIKYAGLAGRNECAIIERRGIRFGLCAFGHNSYTLKHNEHWKAKQIIDSLKLLSDIVIVTFHGGGEGKGFSHLPYGKEEFLNEDRGNLRHFAHFCIDNGADIVFGHGPHVVRCVELYKDRFIAYSLGNFCTPYGISISGISGYAPIIEAKTDRKGRFIEGQIHSFIQKRGLGPRRDTTNTVADQIRRLTDSDIANSLLVIDKNGKIRKK